jgi:CPA1 family monovalent cation:H+ antiporter
VSAVTTGQFSALHAAGKIIYSSIVGVAIGLAVGVTSHVTRRWLDDPPLEILASLLTAYAAFLPAQAAGASGVLAAVTAGLFLGWQSSGSVSAQSRLQSSVFWNMLVFLVNGVLFILVGLSFHTFTAQARGSAGRLLLGVAGVAAAVVLVRLVWVFGTGWFLRPRGHGEHQHAGWRERLLLGWAGMRGALTLAAALAVPTVSNHGVPLAGRVDMIYLAFGVIGVTLVGQGMTLPLVARGLGMQEADSVAELERQTRLELARGALRRLDELREEGEVPEEVAEPLRHHYVARARELQLHTDASDDGLRRRELEAYGEVRRELVAEQRRMLIQMRRRRQIGTTTLRAIERDLDLEEARLH